jgi:hypothetical protein
MQHMNTNCLQSLVKMKPLIRLQPLHLTKVTLETLGNAENQYSHKLVIVGHRWHNLA